MGRLTPRTQLALALAVLSAPTFLHDAHWLASGLLAALLFSGAGRWRLLRKTLLSMAVFNATVSLGVVISGLWQGAIDTRWLLTANLRTGLMLYLAFWLLPRIDLTRALAAWPVAARWLVLALGQARALVRLLAEMRLAFTSRSIARPRLHERRRLASAQAVALLDTAHARAAEIAQALRSRGAFD